MNRWRRLCLLAGLAATAPLRAAEPGVRAGRVLEFPRDHGAHPETAIEWWYATGWLGTLRAPRWGFQVTFFRSRTGLGQGLRSRFAARQLLFAHAAITDLAARRHHHAQRIARWSGDKDSAVVGSATHDTDVRLGTWSLRRAADGGSVRARIDAEFVLELELQRTQPLLLQGQAGYSRKSPQEQQASHYYSEPQMSAQALITLQGHPARGTGQAWLDHEWSESLLHREAVGWDWIGINLADGSALTAFQLRRADGTALWAGGSWRAAGGSARIFGADELRFTPQRWWTSPATAARYPVQWQVDSPSGRYTVNALLDAQELDSRLSSGTLYWEGLAELRDGTGRVGLGYLELTGYGQPLRLG